MGNNFSISINTSEKAILEYQIVPKSTDHFSPQIKSDLVKGLELSLIILFSRRYIAKGKRKKLHDQFLNISCFHKETGLDGTLLCEMTFLHIQQSSLNTESQKNII